MITLFSKCWVTTSFSPVYNLSPCLCNTIVYAFRYNSSKLSPELFFFWISWIAFFNSTQIFSTYFSSIDICNNEKIHPHQYWLIHKHNINWPCIFFVQLPTSFPYGITAFHGVGGGPVPLIRCSCECNVTEHLWYYRLPMGNNLYIMQLKNFDLTEWSLKMTKWQMRFWLIRLFQGERNK